MSLFTTYLPYFVLVLTLLVFVHEYGHYWVGRRFGIHAEVFSIGFGPELIGWTDRNGTRPHTRPLRPSNIHATIYQVLGIDPRLHLTDPLGRPVAVLDDPTPIPELF